MTKVFKSKVFLGIVCIVLAAVIAFLLLPRLYSAKSDTTQAVKLRCDVPAGTALDRSMLVSAEVGSFGLPDSVVLEESEAVGMVAAERLYAGELLTKDRLLSKDEYQLVAEEQTKGLKAGYCLVTIQLPGTSAGIAGILRAGHIVDVQEWMETEEDGVVVANALSGIYVYDVLNSSLDSLTELDEQQKEQENTDYDFKPVFVVFRCSLDQARTLIRLERAKSLHLTLQKTGG